MSMAYAIENRVPFLDHTLVSWARDLPRRYLVQPTLSSSAMRHTKIILKEIASRQFGPEFALRAKLGFDLPLGEYLADPQFVDLAESELLPGIKKRGILNWSQVSSWWSKRSTTDSASVGRLWICMAFEMWARQFLDRNFPVSQ
jgi:asparagine synthase (glutamine-hydrolysing)